jgi:hypothetical protein
MSIREVVFADGRIVSVSRGGSAVQLLFKMFEQTPEERTVRLDFHEIANLRISDDATVRSVIDSRFLDGRSPFGLGKRRSSLTLVGDEGELFHVDFASCEVERQPEPEGGDSPRE